MAYLNRWSMSCLWVAAMIVAWFTLVPGVVSPSTWVVLTLGGPIVLVGAAAFAESSGPTPSLGQTQATADAARVAAEQRTAMLQRLEANLGQDRGTPAGEGSG